MNILFSKLDERIDYNNYYSIKQAFSFVGKEFDLAISKKNATRAELVIDALCEVCVKLNKLSCENEEFDKTMLYSKKFMSEKVRNFILYLTHKLRVRLGVSYENKVGVKC